MTPKQKTNIMTTTKTLYKGNDYTVTMRGNDFAYAQDANGYAVTDLKTIQALTLNNN
tara:strand:+ start:219 stop:389 length:171 start_codon:yes stop_codon:yes gene_type:complete